MLLLSPVTGQAHQADVVEINGKGYILVSGFLIEPAAVGEVATVVFFASPAESDLSRLERANELFTLAFGSVVAGIEVDESFTTEIIAPDGSRSILPFQNHPTARSRVFRVNFVPTVSGTYRFVFRGSIAGTPYALQVTCQPGDAHRGAEEITTLRRELAPGVVHTATAGGIQCPVSREALALPALAPPAAPTLQETLPPFLEALSRARPFGMPWPTVLGAALGVVLLAVLAALFIRRRRQGSEYQLPPD